MVAARRRATIGLGLLIAAAASGAAALLVTEGEPLGALAVAAIAAGGAFVLVRLGRPVWTRRVVEPETAVALRGHFARADRVRSSDETFVETTVGGKPVTIHPRWDAYLAPGCEATVWTVRTTSVPIAVAVELGPSADADAALGAKGLLDMMTRPGRTVAAFLAALGLVFTAFFELVDSTFLPSLVKGVALAAGAVGAWALARNAIRGSRLHRSYFECGARFALSPERRRRSQLASAARLGLGGAAVGGAVASVNGLPPLGVAALIGTAAACLSNDSEPPPDSGNPGSGAVRPCAPDPGAQATA